MVGFNSSLKSSVTLNNLYAWQNDTQFQPMWHKKRILLSKLDQKGQQFSKGGSYFRQSPWGQPKSYNLKETGKVI